jgi:hypothetical protein
MIATSSYLVSEDSAVEMDGAGEDEDGEEDEAEKFTMEGLECNAMVSIRASQRSCRVEPVGW